jgi:titin
VSLSGTGSHYILLSWSTNTTVGILGYNVFRGTTPGGESSTPLNSTLISDTTYMDEQVAAGATYYYVVTAVASDGVTQSGNSNEAEATVPTP